MEGRKRAPVTLVTPIALLVLTLVVTTCTADREGGGPGPTVSPTSPGTVELPQPDAYSSVDGELHLKVEAVAVRAPIGEPPATIAAS